MDTKTAPGSSSSESVVVPPPSPLPPITVRDLYAMIGEREVLIQQLQATLRAR